MLFSGLPIFRCHCSISLGQDQREGTEFAADRIEDKAEGFERDSAEERAIPFFAEYDWRGSLLAIELEEHIPYLSRDPRAIG